MHKIYVSSALLTAFIFISFSTNPPDGNTGAPGDNFCVQCHTQSNPSQNGTISIEGFPASITPNETYTLTAVNRLTEGNALKAGFQVTILGPLNTRAGDFSNPSASSAVSITAGRQYWDHSPAVTYPDSNVVKWTVNWKAPDLPAGSVITWYVAGNIANGNFSNVGDRIVAANGSGTVLLSSTEEPKEDPWLVFPNPGNDHIRILKNQTGMNGLVSFYDIHGIRVAIASLTDGLTEVPDIVPGIYLIEILSGDERHMLRWNKS
jgi:hypothetical protein